VLLFSLTRIDPYLYDLLSYSIFVQLGYLRVKSGEFLEVNVVDGAVNVVVDGRKSIRYYFFRQLEPLNALLRLYPILVIHYLVFENRMGLVDQVYFFTVTVTTVGYGDISPITLKEKLVVVSILVNKFFIINDFFITKLKAVQVNRREEPHHTLKI
jgi:hypothetical protein